MIYTRKLIDIYKQMTHMQFDILNETFLCAIILLQIRAPTPNSSITPQSLGWKYKEPRLACKHKANSITLFGQEVEKFQIMGATILVL